MSLIEKDLAEAHVYWSKRKSDGTETVPIERHLALIDAVLQYEQTDRARVVTAAGVRDVLESTAEYNRGHQLKSGS